MQAKHRPGEPKSKYNAPYRTRQEIDSVRCLKGYFVGVGESYLGIGRKRYGKERKRKSLGED